MTEGLIFRTDVGKCYNKQFQNCGLCEAVPAPLCGKQCQPLAEIPHVLENAFPIRLTLNVGLLRFPWKHTHRGHYAGIG